MVNNVSFSVGILSSRCY